MKIYKALVDLEKNCPELFYLIKNCKIESEKNCPSAYSKKTKSGFKIGINEAWVESFDIYNLAALIEHELLHVVLDHCTTMKDFKNPKIANVAMDCIINDIGNYFQDKKRLNKELMGGVYLENVNAQYNQSFSSHKNTALEIYDFLMSQSNPEKSSSFDQGLSSDSSEGDGESNSGPGEDIKADLDKAIESMGLSDQGQGKANNSPMELDEIVSPSDLESIYKAYGKKSSDVKKFLAEIEKREKNRKIKNAIEQFFNSHRAESKKSLKKINKRFSFLPYGRQKDGKQNVLLALDVSGSMLNPDDLAKLKLSLVSATNNGFLVDLIFGDTKKLGEFKDIKSNFDFSKIFGGGGTDLSFIFEGKKNHYDCYVVVTDGEFNWNKIPKGLKNKILFLNTTSRPVQGYKNLHI